MYNINTTSDQIQLKYVNKNILTKYTKLLYDYLIYNNKCLKRTTLIY